MRALAGAGRIPFARVLREHRSWIVPLAIGLIANVALLAGGVVPMARSARSSEERAAAARQALAAAERSFAAAEAARDGQATATSELETFYHEVLPKDFRTAARLTHVKLAQMAEKHGVRYERMSATPSRERDSTLEQLTVSMDLSGNYEAIRQFLHEIETAPDFVVIDNMVLSDTQTETGDLTLSLELSTYYLAGADGG